MREEYKKNLQQHADSLKKQRISEIAASRQNIQDFIIETDEIYFDYNRNFLTSETMNLMEDYINNIKFTVSRDYLFQVVFSTIQKIEALTI